MITIEIQKAGFINKGAQLMLLTIIEKLRQRYPDVKIVMETTGVNGEQPYSKLLDYRIYPKATFSYRNFDFDWIFMFLPKRLRQRFGLVLSSEIDLLLDSAGFAYTSQWKDFPTIKLAKKVAKCRRNKTRVILMPQAFGPFTSEKIKSAFATSALDIDLIFTRDSESDKHVREVCGDLNKIKMFPDFTNLISGVLPNEFDSGRCSLCIVPNQRMIDKSARSSNWSYIDMMRHITSFASQQNLQPFILVHETKDLILANSLVNGLSDIPIITEDDPLAIKAIIGHSRLVIGSRFHSLVSSLSQGIPTIGTGWSHKYYELFNDYSFTEGLISLDISKEELERLILSFYDDYYYKLISARLQDFSLKQKDLSRDLWEVIYDFIDSKIILSSQSERS